MRDRWFSAGRSPARCALAALVVALAAGADGRAGAGANANTGFDLDTIAVQGRQLTRSALAWYAKTPPADRVTWGGLGASAFLGLGVLAERLARLRRRRIIPEEFATRFLGRLKDGKLDRGKALDFCELNPSPASRVALAAVRRWGRPVIDLERAVGLAHRVEADRLRRNVATLRRLAALTPLLGLLGTLLATGRALSLSGAGVTSPAMGPALAAALGPLTAGVALAILALIAYDGLAGRVERLVGALEAVGTETIDAIAMSLPNDPRPAPDPGPRNTGTARTPHQHQVRMEIPKHGTRNVEPEDDFD